MLRAIITGGVVVGAAAVGLVKTHVGHHLRLALRVPADQRVPPPCGKKGHEKLGEDTGKAIVHWSMRWRLDTGTGAAVLSKIATKATTNIFETDRRTSAAVAQAVTHEADSAPAEWAVPISTKQGISFIVRRKGAPMEIWRCSVGI